MEAYRARQGTALLPALPDGCAQCRTIRPTGQCCRARPVHRLHRRHREGRRRSRRRAGASLRPDHVAMEVRRRSRKAAHVRIGIPGRFTVSQRASDARHCPRPRRIGLDDAAAARSAAAAGVKGRIEVVPTPGPRLHRSHRLCPHAGRTGEHSPAFRDATSAAAGCSSCCSAAAATATGQSAPIMGEIAVAAGRFRARCDVG